MANRIKGEVVFTAGDQTYRFIFSVNALIAIEEALDRSVGDLGALLAKGVRLSVVRTVFRCGLTDHHPEIDDAAAGRIMSEVGVAEASAIVQRALEAAFGTAGEAAAGAGAASGPAETERPLAARPTPAKTADGTGSRTTAPGSSSASMQSSSGA